MHGTGVDKTPASRLCPTTVIGRRATEVLYDHETATVKWLHEEDIDVEGVDEILPADPV